MSPRLSAALLALYAVLAAWLVWLSRDQINPDGVAYIMLARHWAAGRFELAVTAWWGPLLSWMLAPAVWLGWNEVLTVKIVNVALGAVTAVGAGKIAGMLARRGEAWLQTSQPRHPNEPRHPNNARHPAQTITFIAALALALLMLPEPVTPDMLLTCIFTWYFLLALRWMHTGQTRQIVLAGVLGGLGYLAKSYALPFVVVHLVFTAWMRRRMVRRGLAAGNSVRPMLGALAAVALVTLPWVITISSQTGTPTIGCAAQYARRGFDAVSLMKSYPNLPIFDLQTPRAGRLTCWENGVETQRAWPDWPVLCPQGLNRVAYSCFLNAQRSMKYLDTTDRLGLMRITLVLLAACAVMRFLHGPAMWAAGGMLMFCAGYMPLIVYDRYLWPAWPLQLALVLAVLLPSTRPPPAMPGFADRWRLFLPGVRALAAGLMLVSLGWADGRMIHNWSGADGEGAKFTHLRAVGQRVAACSGAPMASNEWHQGLFGAFWADRTYLGQLAGKTADEVAAELSRFGPACVLVFDDQALCDKLSAAPCFRRIELPGEQWCSLESVAANAAATAPDQATASGDQPRMAAFLFEPPEER